MKKKILITTGGSGGHTMPATIIFDHLKKNFDVFLETDKRGSHFIDSAKYKYRVFSSVKLGSFFKIPITIYKFILILINSFFYLKKNNFNAVISTGGYMSIPTCLAARSLSLDILHPTAIKGLFVAVGVEESVSVSRFCQALPFK